jgi:acyl-coenzyme A thioesterase PaaI-like protein
VDLDVQRAQRAVTQYFGVAQREVGDWANGEVVVEGLAPVAPHLRGANGGLRSGALLAMIDHVGGLAGGLAALPDGWVVSTNLALRVASLEHRGPLRLRAEVLRRGRAAVLSHVRVHDEGAHDTLVADAVLTSAVLVPENGPPAWARPAAIVPDVVAGLAPLGEWLGIRAEGEGGTTLDLRDDLRNPWGILHGAVVASLVDIAAERAIGAGAGEPVAAADIVLHFLAPGRVGPIVAVASVLGERADGHVVRVEVRDRGADERVMSVAIVTVRRVHPA